jgi:alpha-beta hydrolase superfamily lysophospholipase
VSAIAQDIPLPEIPSVAQPPAPIEFAPWREVGQTEEGTEYLEEFPSPLTSPFPPNNTVPLRIFMPVNPGKQVPVVLILHYWGATDLKNERAMAQELNRGNIAAAVMTLPYHLTRTPVGHHSGDLAIEPDPRKMVLTMTQAVLDVRRGVDFLESRTEFDHTRIGLAGTSLGALVAELAFGVDDRFSHVAFVLGGANIAHIVWTSSLLVRQRDALIRRGFTEAQLRESIQGIEPLKYLPSRKSAPSLVIGGQYDTVINQQSTQELIACLTSPRLLWLDTGHYGGIFVQRRLMREVARFFQTEFNGAQFAAPEKLYAPTIRLGIKVDSGNGFDLGVGLDLLKFDKKGDTFTTLFITPRGPQLFLGRTIAQGFSIGAITSMRKAGAALLWSAVL